jgi:YVTN family beta-propeller protein
VPLRSILLIFATFTVVFAVSLTPWSPVFGVESEGLMYVTNLYSGTVSVIDTNTNTVESQITVGQQPRGIAFDSTHNRMYITNTGGESVSVIDTNTNTVESQIIVGQQPPGIAFDSTHNRMYVSTNGNVSGVRHNTILTIDTNIESIVKSESVIGSPIVTGNSGQSSYGIALDSIHDRIYVPKSDSDSVSIIDTNTNTLVGLPLIVGNVPVSITFAPSHPNYP